MIAILCNGIVVVIFVVTAWLAFSVVANEARQAAAGGSVSWSTRFSPAGQRRRRECRRAGLELGRRLRDDTRDDRATESGEDGPTLTPAGMLEAIDRRNHLQAVITSRAQEVVYLAATGADPGVRHAAYAGLGQALRAQIELDTRYPLDNR
ncbi:hypothetical protein [Nocardia cyriacigeorgica]|uniref:hypothetical protein n=1 Tax=Nocardia cyriacigeorgica TaxID=135487 RepID=UPI00245710AF|nr:hypothetical protein [Nocardia cyriacigeorgica]